MVNNQSPYLKSVTLTSTVPCRVIPGKIIIIGKPSRDLDEVLPLLAKLPNVKGFNPYTLTLTFRRQNGTMTLNRNRVFITQVKDIDEGKALLEALTEAINATWENRNALTTPPSK
jgi:ArsR family metal-binding transcriptional regulator